MSQEGRKSAADEASAAPENTDPEAWESDRVERTTGMKLIAPAARLLEAEPQTLVSEGDAPPPFDPSFLAANDPSESKPLPLVEPDPYIGCTIDNRYKVEAVLGEGGMGIVYLCRHKIIDKKVAIKILRADLAREKEVTDRFLIEAKAASAIGNEHIIDIIDFGQLPDGAAYFAMEFLEGKSLASAIDQGGAMPVSRILHIALQLAKGLDAAHTAKIVHRDLKPDNVFLVRRGADSDFVKILDFGIAKVSSGATGKLTRAGSVFGTPHYMSPEQAAGSPVDHRGDIYALGVILYELASGKLPFDAENFMGILTQHVYKAPTPLRSVVANPEDIPHGLEAIVMKCLSKAPEQRYPSMGSLALDLEKLRTGTNPDAILDMMQRSASFNVPVGFFKQSARPKPAPAREDVPLKRTWPLYAVSGVLLLIAGGIFIARKAGESVASPEPALVVTPAEKPRPEPPPTSIPVPAKAEAQPVTMQVVLAIDPLTAHVFQGMTDLGTSPVFVEVPLGREVKVEARQDGFKPQALLLDGKEQKISVRLEAIEATKAQTPPARPKASEKPAKSAKSKGDSQIGGGEIINPWN
jgi:serine/threonine-protein kinase